MAVLAATVQKATGQHVASAYVDHGHTGDAGAQAAAAHGIRLEVVELPEAKRSFMLLPKRWVVERTFARMAHFRWLAYDERLPFTLAGLHFVAFACQMLAHVIHLLSSP